MQGLRSTTTGPVLGLILTIPGLCACQTRAPTELSTGSALPAQPVAVTDEERDCLGRAMYFESNRSDAEGLLAVGTVVMNRLEAAAFPDGGICAVVGKPRQFATGVLTKPMAAKDLQAVADVTDAVLAGERHPKVGHAMYFHTAGRRFHYDNMHYVAVAGGNAFYEKRKPGAPEPAAPAETAMMYAPGPAAAPGQEAPAAPASPSPEGAAAASPPAEALGPPPQTAPVTGAAPAP